MRKFFAVTAILFSSQLIAQNPLQSDTLDNVVLTATKFPVKQSNTGKVISVINRAQIERSIGKDLAQVLNEQTGLTVNGANSNPGKDKSVFLRGASSSYTLILLDGIPLNDPSGVGGTFDIRLIPLEQIERIEILKGSQSTLYGANAIAGVINIISRKALSNQTTGNGALSYGSYNTFKGDANFSRKGKAAEYSLNYEYYNTDGISEAKDQTGNGNFDKDGFNRQTFSSNFGFNVNEKIKLSPYFRYSEYRGQYDADAFTDGDEKYNASLISTGMISTFAYDKGNVTVNYAYDHTKRNYDGFPFEGKFHHVEGYISHELSSTLRLLAGVSYQSFHLPEPDTMNSIFSPYASLVFHNKGWNVEAGGRYNHHNRYGDNFTYSFNPSYLINETVKLFANASTGFRAPSISELFGPFGANKDLKPEKSKTLEGGIQFFGLNKKFSAIATYFNRDIEDVIVYAFPPGGYVNRDRQKDHGIEAELAFLPDTRWNLKLNYTFLDGEITQKLSSKDTTFNNLLRKPKHAVNFFGGYQVTNSFFLSTSVQYFSKRNDVFYNPANFYAAEPKMLDSYVLWGAYAEYKLVGNSLVIFADVKNITNADYEEVYGYNVQGTNFNGGVRFKL